MLCDCLVHTRQLCLGINLGLEDDARVQVCWSAGGKRRQFGLKKEKGNVTREVHMK